MSHLRQSKEAGDSGKYDRNIKAVQMFSATSHHPLAIWPSDKYVAGPLHLHAQSSEVLSAHVMHSRHQHSGEQSPAPPPVAAGAPCDPVKRAHFSGRHHNHQRERRRQQKEKPQRKAHISQHASRKIQDPRRSPPRIQPGIKFHDSQRTKPTETLPQIETNRASGK